MSSSPKPPPDPQWFVAYTRVRAELKAAQGLDEAGFARFLPLVKRIQPAPPRMRARRPRYWPLFPRYVFFAPPLNGTATKAIADVEGIVGVLTACGAWATVPPAMLAPLMLADACGINDEKEPIRKWRRRRRHSHEIKRQIRAIAQWLDANRRIS
jgi:Transcription termination factor nusG